MWLAPTWRRQCFTTNSHFLLFFEEYLILTGKCMIKARHISHDCSFVRFRHVNHIYIKKEDHFIRWQTAVLNFCWHQTEIGRFCFHRRLPCDDTARLAAASFLATRIYYRRTLNYNARRICARSRSFEKEKRKFWQAIPLMAWGPGRRILCLLPPPVTAPCNKHQY